MKLKIVDNGEKSFLHRTKQTFIMWLSKEIQEQIEMVLRPLAEAWFVFVNEYKHKRPIKTC